MDATHRTNALEGITVGRQRARHRLPETLSRSWALTLFFSDLFAVLAAAYSVGLPRFAGPCAAVIFCGALALTGSYRESYAMRARDEIYHVLATCAIVALPLWGLLRIVSGLRSLLALELIVAAAAAIALMHVLLQLNRRADEAALDGGVRCISPQAHWRAQRASYRFGKSAFDLCIGSLLLVLLAPVMAAAAVAIMVESKGPVIFRQERVGLNGRPFGLLKFKTMHETSGSSWAAPGDARITRVGAFLRRCSIDEFPQLFNVLRGEMSLVGPRPEMAEYAARFSKTIAHYDERHVVNPGLTGWAQVQLRRNFQPSDVPDVLRYDLFYVQHASALLDAEILLKTAAEFLFHRAV